MSSTKYIGRVGALAVALGIGFAVMVPPGPALAEEAYTSEGSTPDRTALIMGGGTVPTPDEYLVEIIKNQYIEPTHPREDIEYVAVTAPMEAWPITGFARLMGTILGPPSVWGPGGAGWWPDAPWWKLTGLFDLTLDQSVQAGVVNLETAMAAHGNDHLVIYGISEGSISANVEKRRLAALYPVGTKAPDIDFVMQGTFNLPNGGVFARFPGAYLPIIDWSFNGPAPTDTQFDTVMINRQYEFPSDVPLYPGNVIADLNMLLGAFYVHTYSWDVSLPADDPTTSPAYQGTHGDTSYYFFETQDLPLFGPLRTLGVPESVIDVVEPFFREVVELGYDRTIHPWEPTPARLIPPLNPATVVADLVGAIGEGINNAGAIAASLPLSVPAAETARAYASERGTSQTQVTATDQVIDAEPVTDTKKVTDTEELTDTGKLTDTEKVNDTAGAGLQMQAPGIDQVIDRDQSTGADQAQTAATTVPGSKPDRQADQPATRRPDLRGPLGAFGQRIRGLVHSGNAGGPTPGGRAVGDRSGTVGPSSTGGPSDGDSEGDGSAGNDADGS